MRQLLKPNSLTHAIVVSTLAYALLCLTSSVSAETLSGEQIYRKQCAECHGAKGEGVKDEYKEPLIGDWSLGRLTNHISKNMPDDNPKLCTGEDAARVARYIHDAFYSPKARLRNNPPRTVLSRLTNRQYETSVADLMGEFKGRPPPPGDEHGLNAEYFNDRIYNKLVYKRIDPQVDFDFGEGVPEKDKFDPKAFCIKWNGSIIAPETGVYEFFLLAENGCRLYVNDPETKLIDAWVATRELVEHRASIRLLGGRIYPIQIEFFKFKGKRASIKLEWLPPHGKRQVIPKENLMPKGAATTFVVNTPFPPDDTSSGYRRGTLVSKKWTEATTFAAVEMATHVALNLDTVSKTKPDDPERFKKIREFCKRFVTAAFRRPLTKAEEKFYVDAFLKDKESLAEGVKQAILLALKSPRFLYPGLEDDPANSHAIASRLALSLWDSLPDHALLQVAERGLLKKQNVVHNHASRMLRDPRAKAKLLDFFHHWLKLHRDEYLTKDEADFPGFGQDLVGDMRHSLDKFLNHVAWEEPASDYRQLLLADYVFANKRMAEFFNSEEEIKGTAFQKIRLDPGHRAGVLTHPYLMTQFSYAKTSSPIHRGVFLTRNIMGRHLKPPTEAVEFKDEDFDPGLTMRDKVEKITRSRTCQVCHSTINPLGFTLESFDAVGRFRKTQKDKPINTASEYTARTGENLKLKDAKDVARIAAESPQAQKRFIELLFQHYTKQPIGAFGVDAADNLLEQFRKNNCNIQKLLIDISVLYANMQDIHTKLAKSEN